MSIGTATLRRLAALNLSPHAMAEVLSIIADVEAPYEERRAKDAARKLRGKSPDNPRNIQGTSVENPPPRVSAPAEPKITNSSNPTEKQGKEETRSSPASPVRAPSGKTALPADWEPSESEVVYGMNLGHSRQRCLAIAEDLRLWAHGKGERRASWPATYQQFLRREAKGQGGGQSPTGPPRKKPSIYELNERANAFLRDLPDEPEHPLALPPYRQ
jgi:hypothetical protein